MRGILAIPKNDKETRKRGKKKRHVVISTMQHKHGDEWYQG